MIINSKDTIKYIINRLESGKRVCYVRYGDGDFIAMYPKSVGSIIGANNKTYITSEIQTKIIQSYCVDSEDYMIGTLRDIREERSMVDNINFSIIDSIITNHPSVLYSSIALQEAFLIYPELFKKFITLLNNKKTLYINHYNENILSDFYGNITNFIKISQYNAPYQYSDVIKSIENIDTNEFDQIILSAGQLSRVIFYDLYKLFPDKNIIDVGSVSDKIIVDTESFKMISLRGHIRNNMDLIRRRIKFYKNEDRHSYPNR